MSENKRGPELDCLSQFLLVSLLFVQIYEGYFIHYFSPRALPPVKKNVVFVIDMSGWLQVWHHDEAGNEDPADLS